MNKVKQQSAKKLSAGFSLIELMISLAIGMFLVAGMFTVYINSNDSRRIVEAEVKMLDDARFALDVISFDLRNSGIWAKTTAGDTVKSSPVTVAGECSPGWSTNDGDPSEADDLGRPVFAFDDTNPYGGTCATDYLRGDFIEARYSLGTPIATLDANTVYVYGDASTAEYVTGGRIPVDNKQNYRAVANGYYVSGWSDENGDGIPSLRQISMQPGPTMSDIVILSGVENLQIQFGIDTNQDGDNEANRVNRYVDADAITGVAPYAWGNVVSAQVWLVVRSLELYTGFDTSVTFNNAPFTPSGVLSYPDDGFKRVMVNTVVQLRN